MITRFELSPPLSFVACNQQIRGLRSCKTARMFCRSCSKSGSCGHALLESIPSLYNIYTQVSSERRASVTILWPWYCSGESLYCNVPWALPSFLTLLGIILDGSVASDLQWKIFSIIGCALYCYQLPLQYIVDTPQLNLI